MKLEHVLIAGGGMAGLHTARLLREKGFGGDVTLLGAEPHPPYDRPPLSKSVLAEAKVETVEELAFPFSFEESGVRARFGERAVGWEPGVVTTSSGARLGYDALVVATGSAPIELPFLATDGRPGTTLRTWEDAVALREVIGSGKRLAIVGAGWIGAEVATAARAAGCEVVVYEALDRPLAAVFPRPVGAAMAGWYAEAGVRLAVSSAVTEAPDADHVLVAVGARPDNRWLGEAFHYAPDGALHVSEHLATSVPGVYAVGDCASYRSIRYDRHLRVEHWDNALRGPETVVANLLDGPGTAVHDPVPYFWSEQFGRMVQYVGRHTAADRIVLRGSPQDPAWSVCWLDAASRLSAVLAVGRPRDLAQGRRLIAAAAPLDAARVADPGTALTSAGV